MGCSYAAPPCPPWRRQTAPRPPPPATGERRSIRAKSSGFASGVECVTATYTTARRRANCPHSRSPARGPLPAGMDRRRSPRPAAIRAAYAVAWSLIPRGCTRESKASAAAHHPAPVLARSPQPVAHVPESVADPVFKVLEVVGTSGARTGHRARPAPRPASTGAPSVGRFRATRGSVSVCHAKMRPDRPKAVARSGLQRRRAARGGRRSVSTVLSVIATSR